MADHSDLSTSENYVALLQTRITGRLKDLAAAMDPAYVAPTNVPANTVRLSSAAKKWQRWTGTAWVDAAVSYAISIDGNAATATLAAAVVNGVYTTGNQTVGGNKTFTGNTVVEVNSADTALRITQTGTGNALVVEDSASPDSTPFVIDGNGRVVIGHIAALATYGTNAAQVQLQATTNAAAGYNSTHWGNAATSTPAYTLSKSRGGAPGVNATVLNNDSLGLFSVFGDDGASFVEAVRITAQVDGDPVTGSMPGRWVLSTTPSGSGAPVERMRIDSAGRVGVGSGLVGGVNGFMRVAGQVAGATTAASFRVDSSIQSDVTTAGQGVRSVLGVASGASVNTVSHFYAIQGTFTGAATHQYGYAVDSNLTSAANNYGFYSNLPAGVGRWNFFANGTAPNYFAGDVRTNTVVTQATSPTNSNVSATLTASGLLGGIYTGTPTAGITFTLPTGTNMDAAFTSLETNMSFEWSVINLAATTHVITVAAGTAHTVIGNMAVAAATSGRFLTRKTAANTFVTYRIA